MKLTRDMIEEIKTTAENILDEIDEMEDVGVPDSIQHDILSFAFEEELDTSSGGMTVTIRVEGDLVGDDNQGA